MGLVLAQSTRHGGVSPAPWDSLNLGLHTDDEAVRVRENRDRFFAALGFEASAVAGGRQVHGAEVCVVRRPGQYDGFDAFVTDRPGLLLSVAVADCVPVLLVDPVRGAVAAVHAGWRGTVAAIAMRSVQVMHRCFGSRPADLYAWVGVAIGYAHFEVGIEVARHFAEAHKKPTARPGKWLVDLKSANRAQLLQAGLSARRIEVAPWCTATHHAHFFSYRKGGGRTGRMLAVVGWR